MQILIAIGQLPFVDDQAGVDRMAAMVAGDDDVENLVERHDDVLKVAAEAQFSQAQPQGEISGRERSGNGDREIAECFWLAAAYFCSLSSQFEFLDVRYFAPASRYDACTVLVESPRSMATGFDGW